MYCDMWNADAKPITEANELGKKAVSKCKPKSAGLVVIVLAGGLATCVYRKNIRGKFTSQSVNIK